MSKSYEELLDYSKKIIERGDGYRALKSYLAANCNNLKWREEILSETKKFDNQMNQKMGLLSRFENRNREKSLKVYLSLIALFIILIWLLRVLETPSAKFIATSIIIAGAYLLFKKKK